MVDVLGSALAGPPCRTPSGRSAASAPSGGAPTSPWTCRSLPAPQNERHVVASRCRRHGDPGKVGVQLQVESLGTALYPAQHQVLDGVEAYGAEPAFQSSARKGLSLRRADWRLWSRLSRYLPPGAQAWAKAQAAPAPAGGISPGIPNGSTPSSGGLGAGAGRVVGWYVGIENTWSPNSSAILSPPGAGGRSAPVFISLFRRADRARPSTGMPGANGAVPRGENARLNAA